MTWKPVSRSLSDLEDAWVEGTSADSKGCHVHLHMPNLFDSMGWMEMRSILVKLYFRFDLELVNQDLDWHRDSEMHTLWKKPELKVRLSKRERTSIRTSDDR